MKHTYRKITNIVNELITFFYCIESSKINVNIDEKEDSHFISISGDFNKKYQKKVDNLEKVLNTGRRPDLEQAYGFLAGQTDMAEDSELHLVAAMIDKAKIDIKEDYVEINLIRYREGINKKDDIK